MVPWPGLQCVIVAHFSVSFPHGAMALSAECDCGTFPVHTYFFMKKVRFGLLLLFYSDHCISMYTGYRD